MQNYRFYVICIDDDFELSVNNPANLQIIERTSILMINLAHSFKDVYQVKNEIYCILNTNPHLIINSCRVELVLVYSLKYCFNTSLVNIKTINIIIKFE